MKDGDIAVIGAGAAGLMAAIWAARTAKTQPRRLTVSLFDSREKIGAKILMSGGTRCNVSNKEVRPSDFQGGSPPFIQHVLQAFTPEKTREFFRGIGVELVLEPTGKYFPSTHSAQTVLTALINEAKNTGVIFQTGVRITGIKKEEDRFFLIDTNSRPPSPHPSPRWGEGRVRGVMARAKKIILATGGLSYPDTGSDGAGYKIAKGFGHTLVNTFPALTPLLTKDPGWRNLSGIALPVSLSFYQQGRKVCSCSDSFLFTHFGFSGPAALDISRHFAGARLDEDPQIKANFLPSMSEESFSRVFESAKKSSPKKTIKKFLIEAGKFPDRFSETLLQKIDMDLEMVLGKLSRQHQTRMSQALFHYPLEVTGVFGYKKAEVTAGGMDLKEVRFQTMESKLTKGLYFAGEILDIDGRIGGFNFQWAWSTGAIAGRSAAQCLLS